jgi:hypothetical protein
MGKVDPNDCTTDCPDVFMDMTLKYQTQELAEAIGEVADGDVLVLTLTGELPEEFGGAPIIAQDVIVILKKKQTEYPTRTMEPAPDAAPWRPARAPSWSAGV